MGGGVRVEGAEGLGRGIREAAVPGPEERCQYYTGIKKGFGQPDCRRGIVRGELAIGSIS